ncbi:MAG: metallophosphoesterase family protein [Caldilineaceae bacterium]|nr:metallophosphoesterase family protein [Caldilineaceae bacterium]
MRIALLSDIHGNRIALDAVLADIEAQGGVDAYWVLGDLVAVGPQPVLVLERLQTLPNAHIIRGNTDVYIATGERPPPLSAQIVANPTLLPIFEEVAQTMAWTQGALAATGWLPFLDALPLDLRLTLPDGTRLLGVHASPGQDSGRGMRPDYPHTELVERIAGCEADLLCVGHTHWPMNIRLGATHVVNLGSVSNPQTPDLCAWYALLVADTHGYTLRHRQVPYDRAAVIQVLQTMRHPAPGFITRHMQGAFVRDWALPENDAPNEAINGKKKESPVG